MGCAVAREVLLRFKTKNYERARDLAKKVAEGARRTLRTTKGVAQELKQSLERSQKAAELRARTAALGGRGASAAGRNLQALDRARFSGVFGTVGEAREKGESLATALFGAGGPVQNLPSLLSGVGQFLPGLGSFMTLLAPLTEKLLGHLEERLQQELAKREAAFVARLDEQAFRSDYTRRLQEDPRFAQEQARRAFELALAEEARLGKRVHRSTADLIADLGL